MFTAKKIQAEFLTTPSQPPPSTRGARQGPEELLQQQKAGVHLHDTGLFQKKVPSQYLDILELPPLLADILEAATFKHPLALQQVPEGRNQAGCCPAPRTSPKLGILPG